MSRKVIVKDSLIDRFMNYILGDPYVYIVMLLGLLLAVLYADIPSLEEIRERLGGETIHYGLVIFLIALIGLIAIHLSEIVSANRKLWKTSMLVDIMGDKIVFAKPVDVEIGRVEITGKYIHTPLSRISRKKYVVEISFTREKTLTSITSIRLSDLSELYSMIIG